MAGGTKLLVLAYVLVTALPLLGRALHLPDRDVHGEVVEEVERAPFSIRQLWTDGARSRWTKDFENALGFRGVAIAADNTVLYHAFGETKQTAVVMLGKNGVLLPKEDVRYDVWRREVLTNADQLEELVSRIARIQRSLRKHRRGFVPILTPPKTVLYWDSIPDGALMGATPELPPPVTYRVVRAALERHGVQFIDMRPELAGMHVPREALWGRDARHWSSYAGCLAVGRIIETFAALTDRSTPPHRCRFDAAPKARLEEDDDMGQTINVLLRPKSPPTPVVSFDPPPPSGERPSVLLVATSFGWGMARSIVGLGLFGDCLVDHYAEKFVIWPTFEQRLAVAESEDWRNTVGSRDLIVLDLFEPYLPEQPSYARRFVDEYLQVFGEE